MSNSNAEERPRRHSSTHHPSLSSLPEEIVLRCLALVPRIYHVSVSLVSKQLRSLVLSPELNGLRSIRNKKSLHVCLRKGYNDVHWFTLRPSEETETATEYRLVPNPTPFPPHPNHGSSTVVVGSKIFFIGGYREPSSDLWILDTRSGNMTQGPSMSVPRAKNEAAVGVIDGKIYVIGGGGFAPERFQEEIQVEVFDLNSETWELAGMENVRKTSRCSASVEGKVYMVEYEEINVYSPRERMVRMVSQRLSEGGRKDVLNDSAFIVCVVEDVLFAFFSKSGVMWFNTKLNVWRRLLGRDGKELPFVLHANEMAEYDDGRLVVLYTVSKSVRCVVVSLHRSGDMICGTIDWSGVLGTVRHSFDFLHCLAVSD
ncbi:Galactose oxidase/kelch repeat superfamily protein [Raphanus sativus]|uniref:F-box/kelch-repeat protein At2g22050-like n=1 Tax=Raphanus sativus TaxID=3726 RepID=A0A6J0JRV9_RAPSA|nr:F-box/kelch-repeat protein At2g22050-like [Raphanus sativus]KAJ4890274.1 Galactose oxidase/kelch repeat superfamily protein [Raphanus sativus]